MQSPAFRIAVVEYNHTMIKNYNFKTTSRNGKSCVVWAVGLLNLLIPLVVSLHHKYKWNSFLLLLQVRILSLNEIDNTPSVVGVFKNPPTSKNLISLMLIMVYECPALLLAGSLILEEDKAQNSFLLLLLVRAQALISHLLIKGMCTLGMLYKEAVQLYYPLLWLALIMSPISLNCFLISFKLVNTLVIVCQELFLEITYERKRYLMRGFAY